MSTTTTAAGTARSPGCTSSELRQPRGERIVELTRLEPPAPVAVRTPGRVTARLAVEGEEILRRHDRQPRRRRERQPHQKPGRVVAVDTRRRGDMMRANAHALVLARPPAARRVVVMRAGVRDPQLRHRERIPAPTEQEV